MPKSPLDDETVMATIADWDILNEMVQTRDEMRAELVKVCADIESTHARVLSQFSTHFLRLAYLSWAEEHVVSDDPEFRRAARAIRKVLDRRNTAPLFAPDAVKDDSAP